MSWIEGEFKKRMVMIGVTRLFDYKFDCLRAREVWVAL